MAIQDIREVVPLEPRINASSREGGTNLQNMKAGIGRGGIPPRSLELAPIHAPSKHSSFEVFGAEGEN